MEKILMICYKRPYPLRSGAEVRMFQYIEILSEYYKIDVVYISENEEEEDKLSKVCDHVITYHKHGITENIRALYNYLFHGMPLQVGQLYYKNLNKWLKECYGEYKYIICFHIKMASYILNLCDIGEKEKIYFDGTDAITLQSYNSYKVNRGWKKLAYWVEYKRMLKYEKKVYETVNNTILISERDKSFIINNVNAACNPKVIFNYAIDLGYKEGVKKENRSIVFMGKMNYPPNVEAVTYFIENIYGKIREEYDDVEFHIIGGYVTEEIKKYHGKNSIFVHGFVEDAASFLQKSTVVIAPMRSGAGLQNKIIQAMYLGCAVITSEIGADGLMRLSGNELIIYKDDKDFINKLIYFLRLDSSNARRQLEINARNYIHKYYSYETVKKQILNLFM